MYVYIYIYIYIYIYAILHTSNPVNRAHIPIIPLHQTLYI